MDTKTSTMLLHVFSRLPHLSDRPGEMLIVQCDSLPVDETPKLYVTQEGSRIWKDQLLRLRRSVERGLADYEVYCLPEDKSAAVTMIHQKIKADVEALQAYVMGLSAAVQNGCELLDHDQWIQRVINNVPARALPK